MKLKLALSAALVPLLYPLAVSASQPVVAPAHSVLTEQTTPRLVVKYRDSLQTTVHITSAGASSETSSDRAIATRARYSMTRVKSMANGATVYDLGQEVTLGEAQAAAARIAADPAVEYAAPDVRVRAASVGVSNDKYSYQQWPLFPGASTSGGAAAAGGANFAGAWATARGANVVVGVIDSGGLPSPDMAGQIVPGYDFVSADSANVFTTAGDGDGRDSDPTDPGDYCAATSAGPGTISDWHGMQVASLIAALADNTYGISGAAPLSKVMHLRAIGRCGGFMSDIADALSWSVGVHVDGIPDNTTPVQVANVSVGSSAGTACFAYIQDAVTSAVNRNVPVVVAAGNEGVNDLGAPANCAGAIVVGGHTRSADLATFSNRSASVTLTAPGGGNCVSQGTDCLNDGVIVLSNTGLTTASANTEGGYFYGTSAAAAHVSAAVALIRSLNASLTSAQITAILKATAKPHATNSYCANTPAVCGAGMLDAAAAVAAVSAPVATIAASYTGATTTGSTAVTLTASVSNGLGSSYAWTQTSGPSVVLSNANTAAVTFTTPATSAPLTFQVAVSTSVSTTTAASFTVTVNNKPTLAATSYSAQVSTAASIKLNGSDADGDTITYSLVSGPSAMMLNGDTLSWTPTSVGSFPATVTLTDAKGLASTASLTFTVTAAATSPSTGTTASAGSSTSSGSGGGGATDLVFLGLLAIGVAAATQRSRRLQRARTTPTLAHHIDR